MWSFLNPMFLWAAAAALIPLILHLMQRRRTVRVKISTVRFLKLAQKRSSNRVRMENFLLWLLRTLLMLAIALAFAVPIIRTEGLTTFAGVLGGAHRDVAIVLDVSFSMKYESGRRKVWDSARESAIAVIEGLREGDRVCVFLADEQSSALIEKPNADRANVINLIRKLEPGDGSCQLHEAVIAACNALKDSSDRERELHIITDGQSLPWNGFKAATGGGGGSNASPVVAAGSNAPPAAKTDATPAAAPSLWDPAKLDKKLVFFVLFAGPPNPENSYPFEVEVSPSLILAGALPKVTAKIAHSGAAQSQAVTLFLDDQEIQRRTAVLEENGTLTVPFSLPAMAAGTHVGRIQMPADGLVPDDEFFFLLRVRKELPTLCVGNRNDSLFLMTALNPGGDAPGFSSKLIDPEALASENLHGYSTIFLCNALPVSGQTMMTLENYIKGGGVLVVFPGDNAGASDYREWNCLPAKPVAIEEVPQERRLRSIAWPNKQDPLFLGFTPPPGSKLVISMQRYLKLGEQEVGATNIMYALGSMHNPELTPFLVSRYYGQGRTLLFTVSADRRWSTMPLSSLFLPIIHQVVQFGAGLGREPLYLAPCRNLALSDLLPDLKEGDAVQKPSGESLTIRPIRRDNKVLLEAEDVLAQGIYAMGGGDEKTPLFVVNLARKESNLQPIDGATLPAVTGIKELRVVRDQGELQRQIDEHRRGRPLTETFLLVALLLAIAELFLANRLSRKATTLSDQMTVELSGRVKNTVEG